MLIKYKIEEANSSGIYKISNIIDDRIYIGSAYKMRKRKNVHIMHLKRGTHHSNYLQNFVSKYGIDSLIFEVIEFCNTQDLIPREQFYLDGLNPIFNMCKIAGNILGIKRSDEFKKKCSERMKGNVLSEETKLKKSIAMKEYHKLHPEFTEKVRQSNRKRTVIHSPETRQKIGFKHKGRITPQDVKDKISKSRTGILHSEESKLKISLNSKNKNSQEKKDLVFDMHNQGITSVKIGKDLKMSRTTIRAIIKEYKMNINGL